MDRVKVLNELTITSTPWTMPKRMPLVVQSFSRVEFVKVAFDAAVVLIQHCPGGGRIRLSHNPAGSDHDKNRLNVVIILLPVAPLRCRRWACVVCSRHGERVVCRRRQGEEPIGLHKDVWHVYRE